MKNINIIEGLVKSIILNEQQETNSRFKLYIDDSISIEIDLIREFVSYCLDKLKISQSESILRIILADNRETFTTFAYYDINEKLVAVYCKGRNVLDIFRSLAHEIVHYKQDVKGELNDPTQIKEENDGTPIENEANSVAGIIMREFGRKHPELYKD